MSDLTAIKNNEILKPFFDRNSEFDLKTFNFFDQDAVTALNWEGLEQEQISDRLKGYQRLLRLGVEPENAIQLCATEQKLDSALAIASRSQTNFIQASNLDPETARSIHRSATEKTKGLMVVLANIIQFSSPRYATTMVDNNKALRQEFQSLPSYQELFGSLDYLQCEHCQSIFSPAAYLVDVLRIVDVYITQVNDIPSGLSLDERRPDLQNIELTCDNTNDTLPYVQIVNEVLEEKLKNDLGTDTLKYLAEAKYPQSLPFNAYLEQNRIYLEHLNTKAADIYQTFYYQSPQDLIFNPPSLQDITWAKEYIELSPEGFDLITSSDQTNIAERYGVEGAQGIGFWGLQNQDKFLAQTRLSVQELNDLLYQNLSGDESDVARQFYINQGEGSLPLNLNAGIIENLSLNRLDRIDRFLRLAHQLGWSFADLDWAIASLEVDEIDDNTVRQIAQIKELQTRTELPIDVLCSFWYDMKAIGKGDKPDRPQDLFDRVYNNPFTVQGQEPLNLDSSWDINDSALTNRLSAALKLSNDELIKIAEANWSDTSNISLNLANLSRLFRISQVLKLIKLKVDEYKLLLRLINKSFPQLERIDIDQLSLILEFAQWLKTSGFNVYELHYIAYYDTEYTNVNIFLREEDMPSVMESLWQNVQLPDREGLSPEEIEQQNNGLNEEMANHFGMEPNLFKTLAQLGTRWALGPLKEDYIELLLTEVPIGDTEWDRIVECLTYISRMYLLVNKLNLTAIELESMKANPQAYNLDGGFLIQPMILGTLSFYQFKKEFLGSFNQPEENLLAYLAEPSIEALAQLTGWQQEQIEQAATYLGGSAELYNSVAGVVHLEACFDLCKTLGCNIDFLTQLCELLKNGTVENNWASGVTYQQTAQSITDFVKAKYDSDRWTEVYGELNGLLQERKCKIIAEFALWKLGMESQRQLSEYLLLDVEMTSCSCNSRIQLAIGSVQTYLQRCQIGVELGVSRVDIPPVWWDWLMNYRRWEANRKVFLYPENYIDPSLRQDASPLFQELQDELLQSEIIPAAVETAYLNYFDKLEDLSKLQIVDSCYYPVQTPKSPEPIDTLFIIGKTITKPHTFYYRSCERPKAEKPFWGHWQEIELQIESDYVAPVYAFNRLFIFWVETTKIQKSQEEAPTTLATVNYSFLKTNQNWTAPQTLFTDIEIPQEIGVESTFWQQVYPLVDLSLPLAEQEIEVIWGGLSATLSSQFNQESELFLANMDPLTNLADDLLVTTPLLPANETRIELSEARSNLVSATVGNLAIFAGGTKDVFSPEDVYFSRKIDVFAYEDGQLVAQTQNLNLREGRTGLGVTTVDNLVIFAGGILGSLDLSRKVDIFEYNDGRLFFQRNLNLSEGRTNLAGATVDDLVIFAGGSLVNNRHSKKVDVFAYENGQLFSKSTNLELSEARGSLAAATVDNLVIFAGGYLNKASKKVDVFAYENGQLLPKSTNLELSEARSNLAAATVGNLVVFAGGSLDNNKYSDKVDVFAYDNTNRKLEYQETLILSEARSSLAATTIGGFVVLAGGDLGNNKVSKKVDVFAYYNGRLEPQETTFELSEARGGLAATTVGNLVVFAGGEEVINSRQNVFSTVDIFSTPIPTFSTLPDDLEIPTNTTVTPVKNEPDWFVVQHRSEASAFYNYGSNLVSPNRLTTALVRQFSQTVFAQGIDGLISLESQQALEPDFPLIPSGPLDFDGAYGAYFWEIFFHIPFLIATNLNANQRYDEARFWYQYIFNPTIPEEEGDADRFWRFLPFQVQTPETLEEILTNKATIQTYKENPYDPHAIARLRIGAYQKAVVMKYIDNLLDWGDALFTQDSWESISQATTLYLLASELLGPKPKNVGKLPPRDPKTFADIVEQYGGTGNIPEFLIELENYLDDDFLSQFGDNVPFNALDAYFCVSENAEFAQYWDRVEDRLYKIRNCQNIQGIERQLALFSPPIDPMQLVRQAAAGDGSMSLFTTNTVPHYRFSYLLDRAKDMANTVSQLGSALLDALEKKDAEELALLQGAQESILLQLITKTKEKQIEEAEVSLDALQQSLEASKYRAQYYKDSLLQGLNAGEKATIALMEEALTPQIAATTIQGLAVAGYLLPNVFGLANGGMEFGDAVDTGANMLNGLADILNQGASLASTVAEFQRRAEDWEFEQNMAEWDIKQIEREIEAARFSIEIAKAELEVHNKTIEQSREIEQFFKNKFTNRELYQWMIGRLSGLFFQTYKLALSMANDAQKCYQYELSTDDTYIEANYWDSNKKGLLAGESLMLGLDQLEKAYLDGNSRTLEIEKIISLRQLDPPAFLKLKTDGNCIFSLDEKLFDLDFPSHYCRQIKTINLSIPAVVGPYQNINATLTQTGSKVLIKDDGDAVKWLLTKGIEGNEPDTGTLRRDLRNNQQIAISKGVNDNGMFVLNFDDERYLPFEGTGAISTWDLKLPKATNRFDFDSITDVIITLNYTALPSNSTDFYNAVKDAIGNFFGQRLFSLAQQFSSAWYQFMNPNAGAEKQTLSFQLLANMFPMNLTNYTVKQIYIQMVLTESANASGFVSPMNVKIEKGDSTLLEETDIELRDDGGIVRGSLSQDVNDFLNSSWSLSMAKGTANSPLRDENGFLDPNQVTNIALVVIFEAGIDWPTD